MFLNLVSNEIANFSFSGNLIFSFLTLKTLRKMSAFIYVYALPFYCLSTKQTFTD
jgi:hypothetical protein